MSRMDFTSGLAEFLMREGKIHTLRKYKYSGQQADVLGVGEVNRHHVATIHRKEDLEPYLLSSGFATTEAWWKMARKLNKNYLGPFYLYEVTLKENK